MLGLPPSVRIYFAVDAGFAPFEHQDRDDLTAEIGVM